MKRALLCLLLGLPGCGRHHVATQAECEAIVDQLVAMHLRQSGFRDPVLEQKRADELRPQLAAQLAACRRLSLPDSVLTCARNATSPRELAHGCLR
jgi:hypothetical protein